MKKIFIRRIMYSVYGLVLQISLGSLLMAATPGSAQEPTSAREIYLNLELDNDNLLNAFRKIEQRTEFNFVYNRQDIDRRIRLKNSYRNTSLYDILIDISRNANLGFKRVNSNINVKKLPKDQPATVTEEVAAINVSGTVTAQNDGSSLPGVNVLVKRTSNGTITDVEGNYAISVPNENDTLVFSSVGFTTLEVPVNGRTELDIVLVEDIQSLNEIVVTGYGTQLKTDVVSSIATVSPEDATKVPSLDLGEMIRGRAAGVQVSLGSGAPGSSSNILIRGQRSVTGDNDPLVIVDGVPVGNLNWVNPADIASIDILKDAAAQAIYGARASNGVILITTKKGVKGKAQVTYDGFYGVQQIKPNFDVFTPEEYTQLKREAHRTVNNNTYLPDEEIFSDIEQEVLASEEYIDWTEEVMRIAPTQNHTVGLSAGTENTSIYTSINYQSQDGVIPNTDYKRGSFRLNLNQTVNDWFKVGLNSSAQIAQRNNPDVGDILARLVISSPLGKIYNDDGSYRLNPNGFQDLTNPLLDIYETSQVTDDRNDLFNLYLDFSPIKNFNYRINASRRSSSQERVTYATALSATGVANGGRGQGDLRNRKFSEWQLENIFTYNLGNENHNLDFTFVQSVIENNFTESELDVNNTANDILGIYGLATAESVIPGLSTNKRRLLSFVGRVGYNYSQKYYITASARADGSSVFGADNKWGYFPAVSLGWNIYRESFLENISAINNLKIRGSYGSVGNQAIDPYGSISTAQQRDYIFGDNAVTGYSPSNTLPNPKLRWETSTTFNVGLDFGLWTNRLSGTLEYYDTRTRDLLINRSLNAGIGYDEIKDNIGEVKNSGVELSLNGIVVDKQDLSLSMGIIFTRNRNEIIDLYGNGENDIANRWFIGHPIEVYYTQLYDGIWQEEDNIADSYMPDAKPGEIRVKDKNGDGELNDDDQFIISRNPSWLGTYTFDLRYRGIDLSMAWMTVQGVTRENEYLNAYRYGGTLRGDRNQIAVNYWTPENPGGYYPRPQEGNDPANILSMGYEDASYVRLQNITLGYTLPSGFLSSANLSKVRFYVTGRNLITITDFLSYSPELGPSEYPEARVVVGGLQVNF